MREAGALLGLALVANLALRFNASLRFRHAAGLAVTMTLLLTFRAPVILVAGVSICAGSIVAAKDRRGTAAAWLTVLVMALALSVTTKVGYIGAADAVGIQLNDLNRYRDSVATDEESSSTGSVEIDSPAKAVRALPVSIIRFLFGPLPWEITSIRAAPGLAEFFLWLFLIPSLAIGVLAAWRTRLRAAGPILLAVLLLILPLALVSGNYGLALRERMQVIVLLVPFIALGLLEVIPRLEARFRDRRTSPQEA
jgi:hypothetical membrane protein